jgi:uncharacterized RDD family membrane protein YckC
MGAVAAQGAQPVTRDLRVPGESPHAVAFANGAIRLLWVDGSKIVEQRLRPDNAQPDGQPTPALLPTVSPVPAVMRWVQFTLTAALIFSLAASMRRRREMQEIEIDPAKFPLASFATRFSAGMIDAIPLLAAAYLAYRAEPPPTMKPLITLGVGIGVYILLTTLIEVAAGRSLGKILTGLHVVGLDGRRASAGSLVMRNVLRIVDVFVFLMPLTLIFFSPLRQRAGDLAAGTIVVRGKVGEFTRRGGGTAEDAGHDEGGGDKGKGDHADRDGA